MDEIFGNPISEGVDELLGNSDDDEEDHDYAGISADNLVREYSQPIREQQHGSELVFYAFFVRFYCLVR